MREREKRQIIDNGKYFIQLYIQKEAEVSVVNMMLE